MNNHPDYTAKKISETIVIDGNLQKAVWQNAQWIKRFIDMVDGTAGMYNTQSAIVWNDTHLYIAFTAEEPFVEAKQTARDCIVFLENDLEVFIDGGIRRGADIFKAIALGAAAVGIGRPVLYSLAAFGQIGIEKMISILQDELTMCMRLLGTSKVSDIKQAHAIIKNLSDHFAMQPRDYLAENTYERLLTQQDLFAKSKI